MSSSTPIRIIMLHGYTQSGPLFHAKTRALEKSLQRAFPNPEYDLSLYYPTAPIRIHAPTAAGQANASGVSAKEENAEPEAYGWWIRRGAVEPFTYEGMEQGFAAVAEALQTDGPFDGAIGFSQGGALAGMLASLLEPCRRESFEKHSEKGGMPFPNSFENGIHSMIHPPLKFAISYSGFGASPNPLYHGFYTPKIRTPMLHFLGSVDTVVEEARSLRLVDACYNGRGTNGNRVVYHPGGHFLPSSQKQYVSILIGFIKETMEVYNGSGNSGELKNEPRAEDMDMPF